MIDDVSGALARPAHASSAFTSRPAIEVMGRHQAGNPIQTCRFAFVGEIFMHARGPDDTFTVVMDLTDTLQKAMVILRASASWTPYPGVVAAGRHLEAPAHHSNGEIIATTSDRLIPQDDSLAKNVAASFKKSRSLVT